MLNLQPIVNGWTIVRQEKLLAFKYALHNVSVVAHRDVVDVGEDWPVIPMVSCSSSICRQRQKVKVTM